MLIFKDVLSGDELFGDSYDYEETNEGFFYEAEGKWLTLGQEDVDIGANPSAEGGGDDEGVDSNEQKVVDLIHAFRLQETSQYSKKDLTGYLKTWIQKVLPHVPADQQADFKQKAPAAIKYLLGKVKELQFFNGESMDPEATMVYAYYKEGASNPTFIYPKYALKEEKC